VEKWVTFAEKDIYLILGILYKCSCYERGCPVILLWVVVFFYVMKSKWDVGWSYLYQTLHPASLVLRIWWYQSLSVQWKPKIALNSYSKTANFLCECIHSVPRVLVWINLIYFQSWVNINYTEELLRLEASTEEAGCFLF